MVDWMVNKMIDKVVNQMVDKMVNKSCMSQTRMEYVKYCHPVISASLTQQSTGSTEQHKRVDDKRGRLIY
ncbi:MAG: hypothetical protein FRX49_05034 [Trebouxia sp. A1-2]|nr:MAG: hypothetical protein FRX49_05034 [Trebouxia sp. A1-2]